MTDLRSLEGLQEALDRSPFQQFLGIKADHLDLRIPQVDLLLPFQPSLARQPGDDQLHGGVIASLIDIAGDYVLAVQLGYFVPTIDLRIDYLRPSHGTLRASARIVRCGRTVGVADVEAFDSDDRPVAVGRCLYATRAP